MKNLPKKLLGKLSESSLVSVLKLRETPKSNDQSSQKYLFETQDGHFLESVLIVQGGRNTVCVSTQLGCKMKCSFCASGMGKFVRNLTAGEIIEQVSRVARTLSPLEVGNGRDRSLQAITNVVFMGMGEPLDNYDATLRAIKILMADWGFGLGGRRITVSTCGIIPKIEQFVKDVDGRVRLSISLHSSQQTVRNELVPINKRYNLDDLMSALEQLYRKLKREITFEYTLIQGMNNSPEAASGLARLANRIHAKVNIIPYNPVREADYQSPTPAQVKTFCALLEKKGVRVTVRQTAGRDINAACGQLRLDLEPIRGTSGPKLICSIKFNLPPIP